MELTYDISISDANKTTKSSDLFVVTRKDGVIFEYDINKPYRVEFQMYLETEQEAKQVAALFPKSVGIKGGGILWASDGVTRGFVRMTVNLTSDGVNKGANETGLKRIKSLVKHAAKNNIELRNEKRWCNSSPKTLADYGWV